MRPWDAQSCRPKGRCFPFTPSRKIAVEGSFILGDSNWTFFQICFPVDTHTDMRVSVTHRPAFARLILGRWKERSLRMKPPSLQILQGIYPDRPKDSEIHFDTSATSAKIKIKKGEKPHHKKPSRKRNGNQRKRSMYTRILSKNERVINEEKEGRKTKQKQKQTKTTQKQQHMNGHGKHGEKKGTNTPALSKKQNKCEAKK